MHLVKITLAAVGLFFSSARMSVASARTCVTSYAIRDTLPYFLQHFTSENGLPQNSVKAIAPDSLGFIWMTTEDGLVRFDGARFLRFGKENARGISSSRFQSIYTEPGSTGLFTFNDRHERIHIENGRALRDTLPPLAGENGPGDSLGEGEANEKETARMMGLPDETPQWTRDIRKLILQTSDMGFFACTRDSIVFSRAGKREYGLSFSVPDIWNYFLVGDQLYYLSKNGVVTAFSAWGSKSAGSDGDLTADSLFKTGKRDITIFWNISIRDQVLFYFDRSFYLVKREGNGRLFTRHILSGIDLGREIYRPAYYDEEKGKLYLGSKSQGLFIYTIQQFSCLTAGWGDDSYYGQTAGKNNTLLTAQGNILSMSGKPRVVPALKKLIMPDFYCMFTDPEGNIWTKHGRWLYRLEPGSFRRLAEWELPEDISILHEGLDGIVWIGMRKNGLAMLDTRDPRAVPVVCCRLPFQVNYIQQTTPDRLWAGTSDGLFQVDIPTKKIEAVPGLQDMYIRSIYTPRPDEIWITTYGNGFFLYNKGNLTPFPLDRNKYLSSSHFIMEDTKGYFWIPTNGGLFQAAKADLLRYAREGGAHPYYLYHDKSEGFITNEFNGGCEPCWVRLDNGYVSLPSLDGLVLFNPDSLKILLPDKELFIDRIELNGLLIEPDDLTHLPGHFGQLNFDISTPYMGNVKNVHIRYALVGNKGDTLWLPVPEDGILSISSLLPGSYTLFIRKQNGFGEGNYMEKRVGLTITAAWYETVFFYLGCLLLLIGGAWLFVWLRVRYIKRRNELLEERIAIKTDELLRRTFIQEKIIRAVSHDIQTPLKYQILLSQKVYEGLQQGNNSSVVPQAKALSDHTRRLYYLVENLLEYLKIQMNERHDHAGYFNLHDLVAEKIMIFDEIALEKGTVIYNSIPMGQGLSVDAQLMAVILHNLMDNAVKVTRNGRIDIETRPLNGRICITVKDTGPGIKTEWQEWLNSPEGITRQQRKEEGWMEQGGIGLLMVKELAIFLGIRVQVSAEPGKGTEFSIIC